MVGMVYLLSDIFIPKKLRMLTDHSKNFPHFCNFLIIKFLKLYQGRDPLSLHQVTCLSSCWLMDNEILEILVRRRRSSHCRSRSQPSPSLVGTQSSEQINKSLALLKCRGLYRVKTCQHTNHARIS